MGWFDEQIRQRQKADDAVFQESFDRIAGAIMGRKIVDAMNDDRQNTTDAIGEILKFYRVKNREVPEQIEDMNEVLEFHLRPSGIMRRTVHLDDRWYRDAEGAMLGRRKDDGSVTALIPSGPFGYTFFDRKTGKQVRISRKNAQLFEREAIAFYKPFPMKKLTVRELVKYIFQQVSTRDLIMLVMAILTVTLVGMLIPSINKRLFSEVLDSGSNTVLIGAGIFLLGVTISATMFTTVKNLVSARIGTKLNIYVEAATMMRVLSLPVDFFKQYGAGELSNRADYIKQLADMLVNSLLTTGFTSLLSLLYINQIFYYAPSLVLPAMIMTLLTLAVTVVQVVVSIRITREKMLLASKESGMSYALISGIQKIRLSGAEKRAFARWGKLYAERAEREFNPPLFLKIAPVIISAVSMIGTMVMYFTAVQNKVSVAEYYAFNSAYGMVNSAFMTMAGMAGTFAMIRPVLDMAKPIMETEPEISEEKKVVTRLNGSIELDNITFRYREDMPTVLENLSLKVRAGQYVAVVGKTGCGKSTLARILLGFEKPQKGAVYYDGKDIQTMDLKSLRKQIGTVMQNGKMFNGDIYSNIVISAPWLTMKDAWDAAEISGLAKDIRAMPMGMNTVISEGQGGISGGQRQRLLIARAVAPKPRILIFDEATSALDNVTQKQVSEALDRMKCTRIVIAHRLSTIRQCDRIVVLDGGKIIEDGTYEQLIARKGLFAELVERQRLDTENTDSTENMEENREA